MVYNLIQQLTRMQYICEIEYEKVKQRIECIESKSFAQREIEEGIIEYKENH